MRYIDRFWKTQKMPTQKSATAKFARKKFVIERSRRDKVTTKITRRLPEKNQSHQNMARRTKKVMVKFLRKIMFSCFPQPKLLLNLSLLFKNSLTMLKEEKWDLLSHPAAWIMPVTLWGYEISCCRVLSGQMTIIFTLRAESSPNAVYSVYYVL